MAVSNFAIVKDKWKGLDVNYYVDKEYEKYAKPIFGNTPEMLTFFSEKLGNYPWEKYSQVVVHDYVSGAMENTSATLHGEFLHQTSREMLDGDNEDIISHELFHQWFGDLVTCESWSNLPLNESFATYGEYLWREYKYGSDAADHHLDGDLSNYLREAAYDKKDLIRFYYDDKEDMFDSHSYAKGGRVLHMLRKYVGDEAFYASLRLYLEENKFTSVEIHQLRLAFEEVTGEDLNWFFNQWFLAKGHPELSIFWFYDSEVENNPELSPLTITIEQRQDLETTPLYKLPIYVDVYHGKEKVRHQIVLEEQLQTFAIPCKGKPDLVNIDAEKMLLCTKEEEKEVSEYIHQYHYAPLYLDRQEALVKLSNAEDSLAQMVVLEGLNDKYWKLRSNTISYLSGLEYADKEQLKIKVSAMAQNDEKAAVRAAALKYLIKNHPGTELLAVYEKAMNDSSYNVSGLALAAIAKADKEKGLTNAEELEKRGDLKTFADVATIYMQYGNAEKESFFAGNYKRLTDGNDKYGFLLLYSRFLQRQDNQEMTKRALPLFQDIAANDNAWFLRLGGIQALAELRDALTKKAEDLKPSAEEADKLLLAETVAFRDSVSTIVEGLIEKEKDSKVLRYLGIEVDE
jgi:aminopeptidase N